MITRAVWQISHSHSSAEKGKFVIKQLSQLV